MSGLTKPSLDEVRGWLSRVPDPEIPVISLTELGIIRNIAWDDETLVVTVTPTYSGCFPRWLGGPMQWATRRGLADVVSKLDALAAHKLADAACSRLREAAKTGKF
jgi:hypothetical protein